MLIFNLIVFFVWIIDFLFANLCLKVFQSDGHFMVNMFGMLSLQHNLRRLLVYNMPYSTTIFMDSHEPTKARLSRVHYFFLLTVNIYNL